MGTWGGRCGTLGLAYSPNKTHPVHNLCTSLVRVVEPSLRKLHNIEYAHCQLRYKMPKLPLIVIFFLRQT